MAQDYDAPRVTEDGPETVPLEGMDSQRGSTSTALLELDEPDLVDGFELPGDDLSGLELTVDVIPQQADEFTCMSCFLVKHRTQQARVSRGLAYCSECES
jgi:hypothetical protein